MADRVTRELFDLPAEMARLPRDHRGYPVPRFVQWMNGRPDFRVVDIQFWQLAVRRKLCWLCGGHLGKRMWFVAGPMCTITRTSSEPPSHRGCAIFAVKNCPFLTKPLAKRNDRDLPPEHRNPGGVMLERNPGVSAVWETRSYDIFRDPEGNPLLRMGEPDALSFWREGRLATREETLESIDTGLPALFDIATQQGPAAVRELQRIVAEYRAKVFDRFLPTGVNNHAYDRASARA